MSSCTVCGKRVTGFEHIGVRASQQRTSPVSKPGPFGARSGIWHFAIPCGHRITSLKSSPRVKYNGGPLWKDGYVWQSIYWGSYFTNSTSSSWISRIETAVQNIENDPSYSFGLSEYSVGVGKVVPHTIIKTNPPTKVTDSQIKQVLTRWIGEGVVSNFGSAGAYNLFLPPGVTAMLSPLEASCKIFCDYHNTANGTDGPFYTVEPYPCSQGCNHCTNDLFDTLSQGLSEEMVELKTDMAPGTGWVIGNEEICDYCDANFVCNRIGTGEYVNAWYDKGKNACWRGAALNSEQFSTGLEANRPRVHAGA